MLTNNLELTGFYDIHAVLLTAQLQGFCQVSKQNIQMRYPVPCNIWQDRDTQPDNIEYLHNQWYDFKNS